MMKFENWLVREGLFDKVSGLFGGKSKVDTSGLTPVNLGLCEISTNAKEIKNGWYGFVRLKGKFSFAQEIGEGDQVVGTGAIGHGNTPSARVQFTYLSSREISMKSLPEDLKQTQTGSFTYQVWEPMYNLYKMFDRGGYKASGNITIWVPQNLAPRG